MARLILTFGYAVAEPFMRTGVADCVIDFRCHFVWGKLKSSDRLKALLLQRPPVKRLFEHWTEGLEGWSLADIETRGLGLAEFCESFDAIELWANPEPDAQLQLVWLLDYLRPHANIISRLSLVQSDTRIGENQAGGLARTAPARRADPCRSPCARIRCMGGMALANASRVVRSAVARFESASATPQHDDRASRRAAEPHDRSRRNRNANAGIAGRRLHASLSI